MSELLKVPGIDVNVKDNNGKTALMKASKKGHSEIEMMLTSYRPTL